MSFIVIWMEQQYECGPETYRKEFDDRDEAMKFANDLNNESNRCHRYEVGVIEGNLIGRLDEAFELKE